MPRIRAAAATLLMLSLLPMTACAGGDTDDDGDAGAATASASPDEGDGAGGADADGDADGDGSGEDGDHGEGGDAGSDDDDGEASDDDPEPSPSPTGDLGSTEAPGGVPSVEDAELPGQSVATYYSREGDEAVVIAVSHDDVLNIRALPGAFEDPISSVPAGGTAELAGRERLLGTNLWAEIILDEGVGWVNSYYLGYLGPEEDVTEDYADISDSTVPRAVVDTVGTRAAAQMRRESAPTYRIISEAPEEAAQEGAVPDGADQDAGRQSWGIDLTSPGDDAVRGDRLTVELSVEEGTYALESVTSAPICHRGATDQGCL